MGRTIHALKTYRLIFCYVIISLVILIVVYKYPQDVLLNNILMAVAVSGLTTATFSVFSNMLERENMGSTPKLVETLFLERNRCSQIQLSCNEIDHRCIAFEGLKTSCFAFRRLNHRVDPFADRVCQARVEKIQYLRPVMSQCQGSILHRLQAAAPHPWRSRHRNHPVLGQSERHAPSFYTAWKGLSPLSVACLSCALPAP